MLFTVLILLSPLQTPLLDFSAVSAGFSPSEISRVYGIAKAYTTRVGEGPFPTEDVSEIGELLREKGQEFGTVTGRPRRCGWFDAVAVSRMAMINGVTDVFLTKLDVLNGFETIKIGVEYRLDGQRLERWPRTASEWQQIEVVYEEIPGWGEFNSDIINCRSLDDFERLDNAQEQGRTLADFIRRVEELAGRRVCGLSVGPGKRSDGIV